ncbi:hypothetical protein MMC07_007827 [Pseudocyphellaria aurata]|nr:hypothetical protein [Pseudocyphellaria aurata]
MADTALDITLFLQIFNHVMQAMMSAGYVWEDLEELLLMGLEKSKPQIQPASDNNHGLAGETDSSSEVDELGDCSGDEMDWLPE